MSGDERRDRLRLARTQGVGPITYRRLLDRFGSASAAIDALPGLARAAGRATRPRIPDGDTVACEEEAVARLGGRLLLLDLPGYPPRLAALEDAPAVIAVLGRVEALAARSVALVGGRNASANGRRLAESLAADLAAAGLAVVSGLARGVDTAAHRGALHVGTTIAAIAGGLDKPYPPENAELQAEIAERGAVVAEAPLGTAPQSRHFPRRNRIIAGLSLGTVVVEAAPHSGSLITARLALDAGRMVFAAPGSPLDPRCRGSNNLLRQGAQLVEDAADVLAHLPPEIAPRPRPAFAAPPAEAPLAPFDASAARREIMQLLGPTPTAVDEVVRRCQFSAAAVMAVLLDLELDGAVEMLPGQRVERLDHRD